MNLDRTEIPKNILVVVPVGGKLLFLITKFKFFISKITLNLIIGLSHLRHILTISNILADRGYNVSKTLENPKDTFNFLLKKKTFSIFFLILANRLR
jgi:hypothetical protein